MQVPIIRSLHGEHDGMIKKEFITSNGFIYSDLMKVFEEKRRVLMMRECRKKQWKIGIFTVSK